MTIEDVPKVIQIGSKEDSFSVTPTSSGFWTNKQISNSIESKNDALFVAEENNEIVGFTIALLHKPTGKATLENLWVHQDYRGKGVGKQLIEKTLGQLKNNGCVYVCSLTKDNNESMISLFDKVGFNKGYNFFWMDKFL